MSLPPFDDMLQGKGCPFCTPRPEADAHWLKIRALSTSTLYLNRDQTYPGYSLLVFDPYHANGLEQLPAPDYSAYMADLGQAARAIHKAVTPDLMNYATLGNVIPHLHVHLIPRFKTDPRWGAPIWPTHLADMPHTPLADDAAYNALAGRIRDAFTE